MNMATVTEELSNSMTQMWANCGLRESSQYLPKAWEMTLTMVKKTRTRQYWKTETQITCKDQHTVQKMGKDGCVH